MKEPCIVCRLQDAPKVPFDLDGKVLLSENDLEIIHLTLQPGEGIGSHTQPFPVVFYLIEGEGILQIEDTEQEHEAGTMVRVAGDVPRGWRNQTGSVLKLLVIKKLNR